MNEQASDSKAELRIPGKDSIELSIQQGSIGPSVIDIAPLLAEGYFSYDPGFIATASTDSAITYIDGDEGVLLHRGYPIEELAEHSDYLELSYLLLNGELPTPSRYQSFCTTIKNHTMVSERIKDFLTGFRADAHPMSIMCGLVSALASFYHDDMDTSDAEHRRLVSHRILAKMPTLAAMSYKYSIGHPIIYPDNSMSFIENFLHMMFSTPCDPPNINPINTKAMDVIFMLHADHEQNASTSTVRVAGSTGANPFACIAAGIAALWGPAHGGANEAVIKMLGTIGDEGNIDEYVQRAKDPDDSFRLMGFGHRVYKNFDPRARVMKKVCDMVLQNNTQDSEQAQMFAVAKQLEEIALKDDYFIEKKLYPNVDFYSGIILRALGIPTSMFTVIFAIARSIGWITHWEEMVTQQQRIARPRQLYTGSPQRAYPSK